MILEPNEYSKKEKEYEENLRILNIAVSFFSSLGFNEFLVRKTLATSDGKMVSVDLIAASIHDGKIKECLLTEAKSGKNIDIEQLQRYHKIQKSYVEEELGKQMENKTVCLLTTNENSTKQNILKQINSDNTLKKTVVIGFEMGAHSNIAEQYFGKFKTDSFNFQKKNNIKHPRRIVTILCDFDETLWFKFIFTNLQTEADRNAEISQEYHFTLKDVSTLKRNEVVTYIDEEKLLNVLILGELLDICSFNSTLSCFVLNLKPKNDQSRRVYYNKLNSFITSLNEKFTDVNELKRKIEHRKKVVSLKPRELFKT